MLAILGIIGMLISVVSLVCWIVFLIQLFKTKGVGHGIGGVICALYTLYFAWKESDQLDANNPPVAGQKYAQWFKIWIGAVLASIGLNVITMVVGRT